MTYAFIIRMHYPERDPRFPWRIAYFQSMVLPRILAQTEQRFDICIRCHSRDAALLENLHPRIKTFGVADEEERHITKYRREYFEDFAPWSSVVGLPKYDVQLGLDSDDLIDPEYVATARKVIEQHIESHPGKSLHLSFQPELFDLAKLKTFPICVRYTPQRGSAFFAIYQPPDTGRYVFAYECSHLQLWRFFSRSVTILPGRCWATAHHLNESTKSPL